MPTAGDVATLRESDRTVPCDTAWAGRDEAECARSVGRSAARSEDRRSRVAGPPGRRKRTRQAPSRTSSSPSPVAPIDGVVGTSLVEAGDAVEYGQDLITIEFGVPTSTNGSGPS